MERYGIAYEYLRRKPSFMAASDSRKIDARFHDDEDTLVLILGGREFALTSKEAYRLLDIIEGELYGPSQDIDPRGY